MNFELDNLIIGLLLGYLIGICSEKWKAGKDSNSEASPNDFSPEPYLQTPINVERLFKKLSKINDPAKFLKILNQELAGWSKYIDSSEF